jgi:hypothetical protein
MEERQAYSPTNLDRIIYTLYGHICQQQEIMLEINSALNATLSVLREKIDGFDDAFQSRSLERDPGKPKLLQEQLLEMKKALGLMRQKLGIE